MRVRGLLALLLVAFIASACNLRRPEVTLTLAPIETNSPVATQDTETPAATRTATITLTKTVSATAAMTMTPTASATPVPSASWTASPTATDSPSATFTQEPTATPTATASNTPTATETIIARAVEEPTATDTAVATDTLTPTEPAPPTATNTALPTATNTASPTAIPTEPPSPTLARTATDLPTSTETLEPTQTPAPSDTATASQPPTPTRVQPIAATPTPTTIQPQPQRVDEALPTPTSATTAINQRSLEPTFTPLPTLDETEVAQLLAPPPPRPTQSASRTAAPTAQQPQEAPSPAVGTAPVDTPRPDDDVVFNPTPGDATPPAAIGAQDLPPTATATRFQPTVAVRADLIQPTIALESRAATFSTSNASVYEYSVSPEQVFTFENIQLGDGLRLFLPNPVDDSSWLRTDDKGMLRYKPIGASQEGVMSNSPFFDGFSVPGIDQNKNRVVELDWSADGRQFSFRIAPPPETDTANAGVWFWQPAGDLATDPTYPIIRDCPDEGYSSCGLVQRAGPIWNWSTRAVSWSPIPGSDTLLLTVHLPAESRNALAIAQAVRDPAYANYAPNFVRYDYGHWNPDGQGIIVSGRRPDGRVIIGEVNNDLSGERVLLDGSALGLWLRDAVRGPNGQVVALGRQGAPGSGPVAFYDGNGRQISGFIGDAAPEDVRWFPDRSMVVVSVRGRQHAVQVDGGRIVDASDHVRNPQFSADQAGPATIPSGVIANSEYFPGQQLRMTQNLNIRGGPSTGNPVIGRLETGDYVAILAGPHNDDRYQWWRVQTAGNIIGWIAGKIDGVATVRSI